MTYEYVIRFTDFTAGAPRGCSITVDRDWSAPREGDIVEITDTIRLEVLTVAFGPHLSARHATGSWVRLHFAAPSADWQVLRTAGFRPVRPLTSTAPETERLRRLE